MKFAYTSKNTDKGIMNVMPDEVHLTETKL